MEAGKREENHERRHHEGLQNIELVEQAFKDPKTTEQSLFKLTERLLATRLFKCSAQPHSTARELHLLVRAVNSLRRQSLAELKLAHSVTKEIGRTTVEDEYFAVSSPPNSIHTHPI